ncbi:MAG: fasciclin domain-containing protein [Verrucomicrobiales bacterium]|nr:fasciclin domain-containing protein [Verrucomicrobiales bacterium]
MKLIATIAALALGLNMANADQGDIVDVAAGNENFSTLVAAVKAAGLVDTLKGDGPFTVFAPTNEAFAKLPEGTVESLLKPENKDKLISILTYHVVAGKVMAADVKAGDVKTVQGSDATISTNDGVKIDKANVVATDVAAKNGVIHVIDSVIMPKG